MTDGRQAASDPAGAGRCPHRAAADGGRPSRTEAAGSEVERTGAAPARPTARPMRKCHFIEAQLAPGLRQGSRRAHAARAWEGQPESPLRAVVSGPRGPRGGRDGQASAPAEEEEAIAVLGQRAPPQGAPACKARAASGLVALAQWGTLQQRLRWRRPGTRARAGLRARSRRTRKTGKGATPASTARKHLAITRRAWPTGRPRGEQFVAQPGPPSRVVELQPLALQIPLALPRQKDPQPQPLTVSQETSWPGQRQRRPCQACRG